MKKKLIIAAVCLLVLFTPIPTGTYKNGGTETYTALTYKVVKWRRAASKYTVCIYTSVYWFPDNFKTLDELWEKELQKNRDRIIYDLTERT